MEGKAVDSFAAAFRVEAWINKFPEWVSDPFRIGIVSFVVISLLLSVRYIIGSFTPGISQRKP